jgi:hypothetical protein
MKKGNKIKLAVFIFLLLLFVLPNLPMIPYSPPDCPNDILYKSLIPCLFGCGLYGSNFKTVTLSSATLNAGKTASSSSAASSSLVISLSNSCSQTILYVNSLSLTGSSIPTITHWNRNAQPNSTSNLIVLDANYPSGNSIAVVPASMRPFTFYPVSDPTQNITRGQVYNYVLNFANGQSISGSLIAQ